jgi:hypothetical protein
MNKTEFTSTLSLPSRLFTLAFLAAFMLMDFSNPEEYGWHVRLLIYAVCGAIAFGARGILLDRVLGKAVPWIGLHIPFPLNLRLYREKARPLSLYTKVVVREEGVYRLYLIGEERLWLTDFSSRNEARSRCIDVAKLLGIDMLDVTGETPERRSAEEADDSLRDSRLRKPSQEQRAELPALSAIRTEATAEGLRIRIPPAGWKKEHSAPFAVMAAFSLGISILGWFTCEEVRRVGGGGLTSIFFTAGATAAILIGLYPGLRAVLVRDELMVSTGGVRLTRRLLFLSWSVWVPADEIQRIEIEGPPKKDILLYLSPMTDALHVFCRKKTLSFGYGLARQELGWLEGTIADYAGS